MNEWVYDCETSHSGDRYYVWLWCGVEVGGSGRLSGGDIESMMDSLSNQEEHTRVLYHNLKFDGSYIINWLLNNKYRHTMNKNPQKGEFRVLISEDRILYEIKTRFKNGRLITIWDSYKILPNSVSDLAKALGLEEGKLSIDHTLVRKPGSATEEEIRYCFRDCEIVARGIEMARSDGLIKMTIGSSSLNKYKQSIGGEGTFRALFPVLEYYIDSYVRKAYRGGFVWVHPERKNKEVGSGIVLDYNSMFSWSMRYNPMPYGRPEYHTGKPGHGMWIARIHIGHAKIKARHIPCIQIKHSRWNDTEYLTELEDAQLFITNIDWELITHQYDLWDISYYDYYEFHSAVGMFDEYIDELYKIKCESTGAIRYLTKIELNSFYGKFGTNPVQVSLEPYLDGGINFRKCQERITDGVYCPVAIYTTAYARKRIITEAQKLYDRLLYIDTDSLHLLDDDISGLDVDNKRLGALKLESKFMRAKYLRPKCYIEDEGDHLNVKCAGMPDNVKRSITFDQFKPGASFSGKLMRKEMEGGAALIETTFTILDDSTAL